MAITQTSFTYNGFLKAIWSVREYNMLWNANLFKTNPMFS